MRRHAHLVRYMPWFALDYAAPAGLATLLLGLFFGWIVERQLYFAALRNVRGGPPQTLSALAIATTFQPFLYAIILLGIMLAVHGMVSEGRRLGYYRFVFAKPVRPVSYYATAFITNGLVYVALVSLLLALGSYVVQPVGSIAVIPVAALFFVTFGGIAFFFSALAGSDGLFMIVFTLLSFIVRQSWEGQTGVRHAVTYLLLPVERMGPFVHRALGQPDPIVWHDAAWLGGYGLLCFALGLVIVRSRSLAR